MDPARAVAPMAGAATQRPVDAPAAERVLQRMARSPVPWLHQEVARRMAERLAWIKRQPATVLDWWAPIGGGSELLRQAYPTARRQAVWPDAAPRPAPAPQPWWSLRRRPAADTAIAERDVAAGGAGLVWCNMGLHWCADPLPVMQRWLQALEVDGFLMFSTFGPGTLQALRELYQGRGWPPPHAPFVDMHDLGDQLVQAGFAEPVMDQETVTLHWPDGQAALAELRTLGRNVDPGRFAGLRTPRWRDRLAHALPAEAGDPAAVTPAGARRALSFEIVYGHALRPRPRPRLGPQTEVSLQDMRSILRGRPESTAS